MNDDIVTRAHAALEDVTQPWRWSGGEGDDPSLRFIDAAPGLMTELLAEVERQRACIKGWRQSTDRDGRTMEALRRERDDTFVEVERLRGALDEAWDDGNGCGLDGWIGPNRGAGEIDDEAVRVRDRCIDKLLRGDQ